MGKVCLSRESGELGIGQVKQRNIALIGKRLLQFPREHWQKSYGATMACEGMSGVASTDHCTRISASMESHCKNPPKLHLLYRRNN